MTAEEQNVKQLLALYRQLHSKLKAVNRLLDHFYEQHRNKGGHL